MDAKTLREIWDKTNGHCHFCGDPVSFELRGWKEGSLKGYWEVDHVIQRQKGGSKTAENCLPPAPAVIDSDGTGPERHAPSSVWPRRARRDQ